MKDTGIVFSAIRNCELDNKLRGRIIALKQQSWPYPVESQIKWLEENLEAGDEHLYAEDGEGKLVAYLNIVRLQPAIDGITTALHGVGNVCVDQAVMKKGLGKQIVLYAEKRLEEKESCGILLCSAALAGFYQKCGWREAFFSQVKIAGRCFDQKVMTYGMGFGDTDGKTVAFTRNF